MFLVAMRYVHKSNNPQARNLNMKLNMNCSWVAHLFGNPLKVVLVLVPSNYI